MYHNYTYTMVNVKLNRILALIISLSLVITAVPLSLNAGDFIATPSSVDELLLEESLPTSHDPEKRFNTGLNRREFIAGSLAGMFALLLEGEASAASSKMSLKRKQEENYRSVLRAIDIVLDIYAPDAPKDYRDKLFYFLLSYPLHESIRLLYRKQIKGPARGLWQIEPETALHMIKILKKSRERSLETEFDGTVEEIMYTVTSKDRNLTNIAKKFNDSVDAIVARNTNIKNPNTIRVGQKITVIRKGVKTTSYKVVSGDMFEKIAKKFYGDRTKWQIIAKYNNLNTDEIFPGQVLKIPHLKKSTATKKPTMLDMLAKDAGFASTDQMLEKCKTESSIGNVLMTNDVFCCFIACTVITTRAKGKIRALKGRKTIERALMRKYNRTPSAKEVEEQFARNVGDIWHEDYNRSTKDVARKKRQFVEATQDPKFSPVLVTHIPPLYISFLNPDTSPLGTVYIKRSTRRWLAVGAGVSIGLWLKFALKRGLIINWVMKDHVNIKQLRAKKASHHPRHRTRRATPTSL